MVSHLLRPSLQILICVRERELDNPIGCSCATSGSEDVYEAFRAALRRRGLERTVWLTRTGCVMNCTQGPMVVVYPAGDWYSLVTPEQAEPILDRYV